MSKASKLPAKTTENRSAMNRPKPPAGFDDTAPEVTEADLARARPFSEMFPEYYAEWKREKANRPPGKDD
jgi:hypothetical protein